MPDNFTSLYVKFPENARPVSYWLRKLKDLNLTVSERTLASLARKHQCFVQDSKLLLLLPEHIDQIFFQERKARLTPSKPSKPEKEGKDDAE